MKTGNEYTSSAQEIRAFFFAHNLASLSKPPPITLLVQEPRRIAEYENLGKK
jgi:hypothetical protein